MIKKIHQVSKTKKLDEFELLSKNKLINFNKDYEYKLWDDEDIYQLYKNNYPSILEVWDKIKGIQKADLGRYLILYLEGGFYCDTDFYINKPLDDLGLLKETYFSPSTPELPFTENGFTNYFIYSPSHDKIFLKIIDESLKRIKETKNFSQPSYVSYTTGKILLKKIFKENNYKVNIFSEKKIINKHCSCTETNGSFGYHDGGSAREGNKKTWLNNYIISLLKKECSLRKTLGIRGNLCQVPVVLIILILSVICLSTLVFKRRSYILDKIYSKKQYYKTI